LQKAYIAGNTFYEFTANENGEKIFVAGVEKELIKYPGDYLLPYFEYIGQIWDPLNIE